MAATSFFGGEFFGGEFFNEGVEAEEVVKTGTGGIDPGEGLKRRRILHVKSKPPLIVNPTGLPPLKPEMLSPTEARTQDVAAIHAEIIAKSQQEFLEPTPAAPIWDITDYLPIEQMTLEQVDAEIKALLQKKLRTEKEERNLLALIILIAASI